MDLRDILALITTIQIIGFAFSVHWSRLRQ